MAVCVCLCVYVCVCVFVCVLTEHIRFIFDETSCKNQQQNKNKKFPHISSKFYDLNIKKGQNSTNEYYVAKSTLQQHYILFAKK